MAEKNNELLDILKDIGIDNTEVFLDKFLKDGIVKEIPILKDILAVGKIAIGIRDQLLLRKIFIFAKNTQNTPKEKKNNFINKLSDPKKIKGIGMKILQVLDRLDDVKKAELIGKLYILLLKEEIDEVLYFRLCYIIDRCYYDDIKQLKSFGTNGELAANNKYVDKEILENLFSNGLLSQSGDTALMWKEEGSNSDSEDEDEGIIYGLNKYSKKILEVI